MLQTDFINHEIQESVFSDALRSNVLAVLNGDFFNRLRAERISREGYRFLIKEKYSIVAYFVRLLENAERLSEAVSPGIAEAVRLNRLDEIGYFSGEIRDDYRHETWRLRSLELFGVRRSDLAGLGLGTSRRHEDIMVALSGASDPFELIGALLFLELFVVYEMKNLIAAYERDLPDLFPAGGYSYDRFPFNPQEYWYSHAIHDTWHFRSIEEPLIASLHDLEQPEASLQALVSGIEKAAEAKATLYGNALFERMASFA